MIAQRRVGSMSTRRPTTGFYYTSQLFFNNLAAMRPDSGSHKLLCFCYEFLEQTFQKWYIISYKMYFTLLFDIEILQLF